MIYRNAFRKIKKSFSRYLSLILIVFVGVGVYAGIQSTPHGIRETTQQYFIDTNLYDLHLVSTMGFSNSNLKAVQDLPNIKQAVGTYSVDVISDDHVTRIHALTETINQVTLVNGRMPSKEDEVLADVYTYNVGDTVSVTNHQLLTQHQFKVVGTIRSSLYISNDYGSSSIGNGSLDTFLFALPTAFDQKTYTDIYVQLVQPQNDSTYDQAITALQQELLNLESEHIIIRKQEIINEAMITINDNQKQLDEQKITAEKTFAQSKRTLDHNQNLLEDAKKELDQQEITLQNTVIEKQQDFNNIERELKANETNLHQMLAVNNLTIDSLPTTITALENQIQQLESILESNPNQPEIEASLNQIKQQHTDLLQLQSGLTAITIGWQQLNDGKQAFTNEINAHQQALIEGRETLQNQQQQLDIGYQQWQENYRNFQNEIGIAQEKINQAQAELANLETPDWLLFNRKNNTALEELTSSMTIIETVATIIPIFFILIALLMTSNAMSRMILEERGELGVLTSLGYSNSQIISAYLGYAISAATLGTFLGFFLGSYLIPPIIFAVFGNYHLPAMTINFNYKVLLLSLLVSVGSISLVTIYTCFQELRYTPAVLLRPLPLKKGKKNILERLPSLWNYLSFNWKITLRNMFRFKKRVIMTLIGVGGCTALLTVGFGLSDSMNRIVSNQFGPIFDYDTIITLKTSSQTIDDSLKKILSDFNITQGALIRQSSVTITQSDQTINALLIVPQEITDFNIYYHLKDSNNHQTINLDQQSLVVTKNIADTLHLKPNDNLAFYESDGQTITPTVNAITTNYIGSYVYLSAEYYQQLYNKTPAYNTVIVKRNDADIDSLSSALIESDIAINVSSSDQIIDSVNTVNDNFGSIVILIIVIAALLALIVLYNLTSINISERTRELATLKVLGFHDHEANNYIYREALILSLLSIVIGFGAGIYLHRYILGLIQGLNVSYPVIINPTSFILAAVITLIFTFIMQIVTYRAILKINMIEALKSVE